MYLIMATLGTATLRARVDTAEAVGSFGEGLADLVVESFREGLADFVQRKEGSRKGQMGLEAAPARKREVKS